MFLKAQMSTEAAKAAANVINKANEDRFIQLQEYDKMFKWTCFYFSGSDIADCCKANTETIQRILDPRLACEMDLEQSKDWADFSVTYKNYQRFIFPSYQPLLQESNTDEIDYFPGSFITACEFLNKSFGLDKGFFTPELRAEWSCIIAGMSYLNKIDGFKNFAINTYGIEKEIVLQTTETALDTTNPRINLEVYRKALLYLQRYVGLSASKLKEIHGGFYNKKCSFLDSDTKNKYLELEKEYKAEVEKMYNLIKDISQLTLCWNNASVGDTFVEGDNVNTDVNINQFLNCCGDVIASEAGIVDQSNSNIGELKQSIKELATRLTKGETTIEEVDKKLSDLKSQMIIIIIVIVILFLMIGFLMLKIKFTPKSTKSIKGSSFYYNNF